MRIIVTIIFLGLISVLYSQPYIRVSNNPGAIADYANLQSAIDNAPTGAVIYIEPTTISYGSITITKKLTLFGGGYDAAKHNGKKVTVSTLTLNKTNGDPSGTFMSGVYFSGSLSAINYGVDSVTIQRCVLPSSVISGSSSDSVTGWKIINCKINSTLSFNYAKNILIANNIIYNRISGLTEYSIFVTNNIFTYANSYALSNTNFTNNIFYAGIPTNADNCIFSNNLTRSGYSAINCEYNSCLDNIEEVAADNIFFRFTSETDLSRSRCWCRWK